MKMTISGQSNIFKEGLEDRKQIKHLPESNKLMKYYVYVVPWALWADQEGNLWISSTYTWDKGSGGTSHTRIYKKDGFIYVDKGSLGDYRFTPSRSVPHFGAEEKDYYPVILY